MSSAAGYGQLTKPGENEAHKSQVGAVNPFQSTSYWQCGSQPAAQASNLLLREYPSLFGVRSFKDRGLGNTCSLSVI